MRNTFVIVVVMLALLRSAGAQRLADGSYQMTGNPVLDVGLAVVNQINREIAVKHDFQQFWINSAKMERAMQTQLDKLREAKLQIIAERKKHLDAAAQLRKEITAARGDKKKVEALEAKAKSLDSATKELDRADQALDKAAGAGGTYVANIQDIRSKGDEAQALAYWNSGVRKNMSAAKKTLEAQLAAFAKALAKAGVDIKKGTVEIKVEIHTAFTAEVTVSGGKMTELYVNGVKITSSGQKVGVGKDLKLELRAMIVPPRREQARKYAEGKAEVKGGVELKGASLYHLHYQLGNRVSHWKVEKETYDWKAPETRTNAPLITGARNSGSVAKNDVFDVTFPSNTGSETIRGWVYGDITWNGPSQEDSQEGLSYEIKLNPTR